MYRGEVEGLRQEDEWEMWGWILQVWVNCIINLAFDLAVFFFGFSCLSPRSDLINWSIFRTFDCGLVESTLKPTVKLNARGFIYCFLLRGTGFAPSVHVPSNILERESREKLVVGSRH